MRPVPVHTPSKTSDDCTRVTSVTASNTLISNAHSGTSTNTSDQKSNTISRTVLCQRKARQLWHPENGVKEIQSSGISASLPESVNNVSIISASQSSISPAESCYLLNSNSSHAVQSCTLALPPTPSAAETQTIKSPTSGLAPASRPSLLSLLRTIKVHPSSPLSNKCKINSVVQLDISGAQSTYDSVVPPVDKISTVTTEITATNSPSSDSLVRPFNSILNLNNATTAIEESREGSLVLAPVISTIKNHSSKTGFSNENNSIVKSVDSSLALSSDNSKIASESLAKNAEVKVNSSTHGSEKSKSGKTTSDKEIKNISSGTKCDTKKKSSRFIPRNILDGLQISLENMSHSFCFNQTSLLSAYQVSMS